MMEIQIAWRNLWRQRTRSIVIILAMVIGLAGGMICLNIFQGMSDQRIKDGLKTETAYIQIHHPDFLQEREPNQWVENSLQMIDEIDGDERVSSTHGSYLIRGMANTARKAMNIEIVGIDPQKFSNHTDLAQRIVEGEYFPKKKNRVYVGQKLLEELKIKVNSKVVLTFQDSEGNITGAAFKVCGSFKTSNSMFDKSKIFVRRADLTRIAGYPKDVSHKVSVMTHIENESVGLTQELKKKYSNLKVEHWRIMVPELGMIDGYMNITSLIYMGILFFGLGFGILNTMRMAIMERTRELGILMAVGLKPSRIFTMILMESLFLTLIGSFGGILLNITTITILNKTGIDLSVLSEGLESFGYRSYIYPEINWRILTWIPVFTLVTAIVAGVFPARYALKLNPSQASRME